MNGILNTPHLIKSNQPISNMDFVSSNIKFKIISFKNSDGKSYTVFSKRVKKNELVEKKTNVSEFKVNSVVYQLRDKIEKRKWK